MDDVHGKCVARRRRLLWALSPKETATVFREFCAMLGKRRGGFRTAAGLIAGAGSRERRKELNTVLEHLAHEAHRKQLAATKKK